MTALVLQARLDSVRLPGKSMLPLGGRPLVFRVMEAFFNFNCDEKILACPEDSADAFAPLASEAGFALFKGPKEDVLARYCLAARKCRADRVVRATADNPFVFIDAADCLNREAAALDADYAGFSCLPIGAGVEVVSSAALFRAESGAGAPDEREHVCPYLYKHPELFRLHRPAAPAPWQAPGLSLTVDTEEDLKRAQLLYERMLLLKPEERNLGENIIASARVVFGYGDFMEQLP